MAKNFINNLIQKTKESNLVPSIHSKTGYYLRIDDNIFPEKMNDRFVKMFRNGSGKELSGKALAVHSSSMLAFNFFHWISEENPLTIDNYRFTKVYFEVQLPTLKGTTPANMDVVLEGKSITDNKPVLLFIESKFTEHFKNSSSDMKKMLNSSYTKEQRTGKKYDYYPYNAKRFRGWLGVIQEFQGKTKKGYVDGIKQEICHMIALTNLKHDLDQAKDSYKKNNVECPTINGDETFLFYNILFEPNSEFKESGSYKSYKDLYDSLNKQLTDNELNKGIECKICSYKEIYDKISNQSLKSYLESRYMRFAKQEDSIL